MRDDGENLREPSNLRVVAGALLEHFFCFGLDPLI
jgi:hypothetical protein